ncbi:MAG: hypothetical protein GX594_02775 [Pirellulaceae bacterium]|nr:hypothetical protein [Pirellulaceae bacterium]
MASPFKVFRKNQKQMLAVLTILTVFSFTFGYMILEMIGSGGGGVAKQAAFNSKYGSLNERELSMLRERHNKVMMALSNILQNMGVPQQQSQAFLEYNFGGASDEDLANSWLLARRAEELGMIVDKDTINEYLKRLTENQFTAAQFDQAFKNAGINARIFFDLMHDELLALKLRESFRPSLQSLTPAQRWDYYCRIFKRASIEAVPVPVADYIDRIEDPGDAVLREFHAKYHDKLPAPYSPEPGFKEPQRAAIEYFKAGMEQFASPEAVSVEEVMEHYEKNKERYNQVFPPLTAEEAAAQPEQKPDGDAQAKPDDHAAQAEAVDPKPAETPPPVEEKTPEPSPPEVEKNVEPVEPNVAPMEKSEGSEETAQPQSSAGGGQPTFVLAAFQQPEPDEQPSPEAPRDSAADAKQPEPAEPTEKPAEPTEKPAEPVEKPVEPTEKPAEPTEKQAEPTEKPAEPVEKPVEPTEKPAEPAADQPGQPDQPTAGDTEPPIRGTTEQLKQLIRREIAMTKIEKIFERLSREIGRYRDLKSDYDFSTPAQREGKLPPQRPDYEKLAQENGLTFGETGLLDEWHTGDTEIGAVLGQSNRGAPYLIFHAMGKLRPEIGSDTLRENIYLFWKTDESKEDVPKFDDAGVRERVLREWKMIEARKLALEEAKILADQARETGKPLAEVFADLSKWRPIAPPSFSWMTLGSVAMSYFPQPEISAVEGVQYAGDEFMRTVFSLKPGEIGSAMNAPQTIAYVIRVKEFAPDYEELWDRFKTTDFRLYASIAQQDMGRMVRAWLADVQNQSNFQWTPEHLKLKVAAPLEDEE